MLLFLQDATEMTEIHSLVEIALAQYDADKIGIPDYALESAGKAFVVVIVFCFFFVLSLSLLFLALASNLHSIRLKSFKSLKRWV